MFVLYERPIECQVYSTTLDTQIHMEYNRFHCYIMLYHLVLLVVVAQDLLSVVELSLRFHKHEPFPASVLSMYKTLTRPI